MEKPFCIGCQLIVIILLVTACNFGDLNKTTSSNQEEISFSKNENDLLDTLSNEKEKIYTVVEKMPCFKGCEDLPTSQERKKCSDAAILKFIFNNFKYPEEAKRIGIDQKIVVRFVVDEEGKVQDVKALRNHGNSLGTEIERVFQSMPDWNAGKHKGKTVKVEITFPINIKPEKI